MLQAADRLLEDVYDFIYKTPERDRTEVARIALLAAQHRAEQLKQQRLRRAAERLAEERRQLRSSARADEPTDAR